MLYRSLFIYWDILENTFLNVFDNNLKFSNINRYEYWFLIIKQHIRRRMTSIVNLVFFLIFGNISRISLTTNGLFIDYLFCFFARIVDEQYFTYVHTHTIELNLRRGFRPPSAGITNVNHSRLFTIVFLLLGHDV